eukprot:EG_transcript_21772
MPRAPQASGLIVGRRAVHATVSAIIAAWGITPPALGVDARQTMQQATAAFFAADIDSAVRAYDSAAQQDPRVRPYMWQRGIALYYAGEFEACAQQFRLDVSVNPNDTEEAIWAFLCEARDPAVGFAAARERLLQVGPDPRPYMRAAYALFQGRAAERDLEAVGADRRTAFYSNLYLGLYAEAKGQTDEARRRITAAVNSPYRDSGDYMYGVAQVHQRLRGW